MLVLSGEMECGTHLQEAVLAYMGADDEEIEEVSAEMDGSPDSDPITTDLSHMYSLDDRPRASSLELQGFLGTSEIFILVDTGSTHNFVHPRIAESTKFSLTAIRPFRVYMGNDESLVCSHKSSKAEVRIQGISFCLDLFVLSLHGPDMILGMAWLHSLHRVTSDYDAGTLAFLQDGHPVTLRVAPRVPRQVSVRQFASLLLHLDAVAVFEIIPLPGVDSTAPSTSEKSDLVFPANLPQEILHVLMQHGEVFGVPSGLPPARSFDHRIHLLPNSKPVNVRPYRYPYF